MTIEDCCTASILQPHSFIRIKSLHLIGKTILIEYVLDRTAQQGYLSVKINFQNFDEAILAGLAAQNF
jgi:AAA-like domain